MHGCISIHQILSSQAFSTRKGSQLGDFSPYEIVCCYLELKLRYIKNLKLFSIWMKELFEPIVLQKKKGDGFLLKKPILTLAD